MKINGMPQIKGISKEINKLTGKRYGLSEVLELQKAKTDLSQVSEKVKGVKKEIENISHVKYNPNAIQEYINKYGQVETKAKTAKQEVKELNNQVKKSSGISVNINNFSTGIDKVISKIKRFGLSLFSIRSIYTLISKASSAYLSQDIELSDKLQACWSRPGSDVITNN